MKKQVAILAGGLATRLRPLTEKIPKAMIEIRGKPFLEHQINLCKKNGVSRIVFCGGYLWETVFEYFRNGKEWGVEIVYSVERERLDTGGALKNALPFLEDDFFVLYGDSYLEIDWQKAWKCYKNSGAEGLMTVYRNKPDDCLKSQISMDKAGFITEFTKNNFTPEMRYVEYGLNIFNKDILNRIKEKSFPIGHYFDLLIKEKQLIGYESPQIFQEIGTFEGINKLINRLD